MVAAIDQRHLDIDDRIARQHAAFHRLDDALLYRRDIFARHGATHDFILEDEARARLIRLHLQPDMTVLTAPTGLAHESDLRS